MRLRALAIWLVLCALAFVCLKYPFESKKPPLLVENVALKDFSKDHMLFAPCPGGQFAPRPKRYVT